VGINLYQQANNARLMITKPKYALRLMISELNFSTLRIRLNQNPLDIRLLLESKSNALEETKLRFTSNMERDKNLLVLKHASITPHTSLILVKKTQFHSLFLISATKLIQIERDASYTLTKLLSMSLVQLTSSQNFLQRLLSNQFQA
jgi:hypothetical protein